MKIAGHLILPDDGERVRLAPGWLRIEDGRIAQVVEGDIPSDADAGGEGTVVSPGLIDTHMHLPQFGIIGAHGLGLLDWLQRVTFPAELRWEDPAHAQQQTANAIRRMLRCGTTGFAAYATVHADGARAALDTATQMGVRAHIGQVLMDRGAPAALCRPAAQLIDEAAALQASYPAGGRVSAAVTPRFAPTCSEDLLNSAGRLAQETGALVQTHLAETPAECALVGELFPGRTYTEVYRQAGLLAGRSILGHGIYLDAQERRALIQDGATVAHCPTANSFLMSGRMPWGEMAGAGVSLALGSDIGGGYEVSMVRVARAMIETAGAVTMDRKGRGAEAPAGADANRAPGAQPGVLPGKVPGQLPGVAQAWHQITAGNASALGWAETGTLAPGLAADLVLIQPDADTARTLFNGHPPDPLAGLMFGWDDRWVREVMVAGEMPNDQA